jgi:alkylation response protein AidB-like acyl-CoA dehydrogenase
MDAAIDATAGQFELNEDQLAIREMAGSFAAEKVAPFALEWDKARHFPEDVIRETGQLGFGGLYVKEDVGGSALTRLDAVLVFEQLAHACPGFSSFISIHNMAASMIDRFGNEEQRQRLLPRLTSMEWLASYCLTEPGSGSDAAALKTKAVRSGGNGSDFVVNGTKQFISGAGDSDVYVAMVRTGADGPKGISTLVIPKDAPGLSFGANEHKMGWHMQSTRQVIFDDCKVPAENLLSDEGAGFGIAMAGLDGGRLNIAACSVGGARGARQGAGLHRRAQGLRPAIDRFQALQFRLADMETELQAARLFLCRRIKRSTARRTTPAKCSAPWPSASSPTPASRLPTRRCSCIGGYGYLARLRHREAGARPQGPPDPRRHQRDHACDHRQASDRAK